MSWNLKEALLHACKQIHAAPVDELYGPFRTPESGSASVA